MKTCELHAAALPAQRPPLCCLTPATPASPQMHREFKTFTEIEEEHALLQQPRSAIQYFL